MCVVDRMYLDVPMDNNVNVFIIIKPSNVYNPIW